MATGEKSGKEMKEKGEQNNQAEDDPEIEFAYRSGHLFVIDASPEMFSETGGEPEPYFHQCLMAFERILRQKLSMSKDDWMGLMLFATKQSDPEARNILTLIEFEEISVEMLMKILEILRRKMADIESLASDKHYPLANVLLHAARAFDAVKIMMPYRQVVLLTCHDNPVPDDNDERNRARMNAKSYRDTHVTLKVVGFGDKWEYENFYKDLEIAASESIRIFKKTELIDLETSVTRRATNIGNLKLKIGNNYVMKVQLNALAKRRRYVETCLLDRETNEPLNKAFHYRKLEDFFDEDEVERAENWETDEFPVSGIRKCQMIGGKSILLSLQEFTYKRKINDRGIKIIRFEPALKTEPIFHVQLAFFLVLPEDASRSQKLFFAALLAKCKEKKVMAICAATLRDNSRTLLFRMWPGEDMNGFYFYRIPYRNELNTSMDFLSPRYAYHTGQAEYPFDPEKLNLMKKVMKKFKIVYNPQIFPNPSRARRMAYLQSLALHEDVEPHSFEDYTQPAVDILEQKLKKGALLEQYEQAFPKSQTQEDNELKQAKKVLRYSEETARSMLLTENLSNYTVVQLKGICKAIQIAASGIKRDLVQRLEKFRTTN